MSAEADEVLTALERLGYGGLTLDPKGRVLRANEKAKQALTADPDARRGTAHQDVEADNALQAALREALRASSAISPRLGEVIVAPRTGKRPLLLCSLHLRSDGMTASEPSSITALVLLDLDDCPAPSGELLRQVFGFTPAEARVARLLSCGQDLSAISEELGVGIGTLRMQLKSMFSKTGTHRQAELVALLNQVARLSPSWAPD